MIEIGTRVRIKNVGWTPEDIENYAFEEGKVVPHTMNAQFLFDGEWNVLLDRHSGPLVFHESELEIIRSTEPCVHCGEGVWGYEGRVPLFPSDVQWGVHLVSDKFSCPDGVHMATVEV